MALLPRALWKTERMEHLLVRIEKRMAASF